MRFCSPTALDVCSRTSSGAKYRSLQPRRCSQEDQHAVMRPLVGSSLLQLKPRVSTRSRHRLSDHQVKADFLFIRNAINLSGCRCRMPMLKWHRTNELLHVIQASPYVMPIQGAGIRQKQSKRKCRGACEQKEFLRHSGRGESNILSSRGQQGGHPPLISDPSPS